MSELLYTIFLLAENAALYSIPLVRKGTYKGIDFTLSVSGFFNRAVSPTESVLFFLSEGLFVCFLWENINLLWFRLHARSFPLALRTASRHATLFSDNLSEEHCVTIWDAGHQIICEYFLR